MLDDGKYHYGRGACRQRRVLRGIPQSLPHEFIDFAGGIAVMNVGHSHPKVVAAVKIDRYHTKKTGIIALENAFHGRTLLAMSLTHKVKPYKFGFGPFAPEIYSIPSAYGNGDF